MTHRLGYAALLVVIWVALWGEATAGNVVSGLLVAGGLLIAFPEMAPRPGRARLRPVRVAGFAAYFAYKLVEANLQVAWQVLTNARVREGIVAVPVADASDAVLTVVANAISLTPGTLTLEVRRDPPTLYVHVLQLTSPDQVRRDIRELERRALRAFGAADVVGPRGDAEAPGEADAGAGRGSP